MSSNNADQMGDLSDAAKSGASWFVTTGQKAVVDISSEARGVLNAQVSKQKDLLADRIAQIAKALRAANESLHNSSAINTGEFGDAVIKKVDDLALSIHKKDVAELAKDTAKFARANPAVFLWAAVGIGFVTARFMKSHSATA